MMFDGFDTRITRQMILFESRHLPSPSKQCDALAAGDGNKPLRQARHVTNGGQSQIQLQTHLLENFVRVALVWTQQPGYGVDQPLVTPNKLGPGGLISIQTSGY